ncbi:hypothetical protein SFC43_08240 [Bacteroides sp. CR5/BHMF/2]|nr:hypothetical protein [Bacteroides sp. CR5/BHMF/2]
MEYSLRKMRKWDWTIVMDGLFALWDILFLVPGIFPLRGKRRRKLFSSVPSNGSTG